MNLEGKLNFNTETSGRGGRCQGPCIELLSGAEMIWTVLGGASVGTESK